MRAERLIVGGMKVRGKKIGFIKYGGFVLTLLSVLTSCAKEEESKNPTMMLQKTEFSKETKDTLEMLGVLNSENQSLLSFDYNVDDSVKTEVITIWSYQDGEWIGEKSETSIHEKENQIMIHFYEESYDVFHKDGSGYIKSTHKNQVKFDDTQMLVTYQLSEPKEIIIDEEITLWYQVGTKKDSVSVVEDFRSVDCEDGIAITVTFLDE